LARTISSSIVVILSDDDRDDDEEVDAADALEEQDRLDDDRPGGRGVGTARSTASRAAAAEGAAGGAWPEREVQVRMAALSASLGMTTPPGEGGSPSTPDGETESSAQARMHARSYVSPDGRITGSAMGVPRIGHRNSRGTSSSSSSFPGRDGAGGGDGGGGLECWKGSSFQRRARAAPMLNYRVDLDRQRQRQVALWCFWWCNNGRWLLAGWRLEQCARRSFRGV
jgi:hypothetical protein